MSKSGFIDRAGYRLPPPSLHIIQYSLVRDFNQWRNPGRNAPYWRFYRSLSPGSRIRFDGRDYDLPTDRICLIPPNVFYASDAWQPFSQFYLHFIWRNGHPLHHPLFLPVTDEYRTLHDYEQLFENDDKPFTLKIYALLLKYLAQIPEPPPGRADGVDPRILHAVQIMEKDIQAQNREIADRLHLSRDTFQRLFRKEMGTTPRQYMIARRMELAQSLLMDDTRTLDDIARATGFSNRYQFSKTFTRFFKVPPGAFRRNILHPMDGDTLDDPSD